MSAVKPCLPSGLNTIRLLLCITLLVAGTQAQAIDSSKAAIKSQLMVQLGLGESRQNEALIDHALSRLVSIAPADPDVLEAQIRTAVRRGETLTATQLYQQLSHQAPDSLATQRAQLTLELNRTAAREALGRARLLAAAGRLEEAIDAYDALFHSAPPTPRLALEYWQLVARQPGQRPRALQALLALNRHYAEHPGLNFALVRLLLAEERYPDAYSRLDRLSDDGNTQEEAARQWLSALREGPETSTTLKGWQSFVSRFPDHPDIAFARNQLTTLEKRLADPAYQAGQRGLARYADDTGDAAVADLTKAVAAYPNDTELLAALGIVRMRQGRHGEALALFQRAQATDANGFDNDRWVSLTTAARYWRQIALAADALDRGDFTTAEQFYQGARHIDPEPDAATAGLASVNQARRQQRLAELREMADSLAEKGLWALAEARLREALPLAPENIWLTYDLAQSLRQQNRQPEGDRLFRELLERPDRLIAGDLATARYAEALYLASDDRDAQALASLGAIPSAQRDTEIATLYKRLQQQQTLREFDTRLTRIEAILPQKPTQARQQLARLTLPDDPQIHRRAAELWQALDEHSRAEAYYQPLLSQPFAQKDPLLWRDAARTAQANGNATLALNRYREGLIASGLASPTARNEPASFTQAMRQDAFFLENDTPQWLANSLRNEAETLYQQRNSQLRLDQITQSDEGTGGVSELSSQVQILNFDAPVDDASRLFVQLDVVSLDAGRFPADADGLARPVYGTCAEVGCDVAGKRQHERGASIGLGWYDATWRVDMGTTPLNFPVTDWVGGIRHSGSLGPLWTTANVSKRRLGGSLLSFAGAQDPNSEITWGGVNATGASLGLGYDQGGSYGLWSNLSAHHLSGTSVEDNYRLRLMGGAYHRWRNRPDSIGTWGLNTMAMHYDKDLSGYSLGQGGYYSPQQSFSLSVPVSYRQRSTHWVWALEASVSHSWSESNVQPRYPLKNPATRQLPDAVAIATGGRGGGLGFSAAGRLERRLGDHWRSGISLTLQNAEDYSPTALGLYLRYSFLPWQGDLALEAGGFTPYADFE